VATVRGYVLTFFVVTYIVTWSAWFAAGMTPAAGPRGLLYLLGTFAPGFVALWLTGRATGRSGVAALLRRLIDWQVPARWYVFAVSYIVVVKLIVALVHRASTGAWPRFGEGPWYLMLAATFGWGPLSRVARQARRLGGAGMLCRGSPRVSVSGAGACCSVCCGRSGTFPCSSFPRPTRPASHSRSICSK